MQKEQIWEGLWEDSDDHVFGGVETAPRYSYIRRVGRRFVLQDFSSEFDKCRAIFPGIPRGLERGGG